MGKMHTDQVYELLNADIEEERENNFFLDGQLTHNEERLNASKELAIASAWILLVCLFIGTGNLLTVILLIYGIVMDSSLHMILWILSSSITYFISIIALLVLYLKPFHELYILYGTLGKELQDKYLRTRNTCFIFLTEITVIISTLFIPVWLVITMHYYNLRKTNNKTKNLYTTTIKGDGGYLHSLNALDEIQKILVI